MAVLSPSESPLLTSTSRIGLVTAPGSVDCGLEALLERTGWGIAAAAESPENLLRPSAEATEDLIVIAPRRDRAAMIEVIKRTREAFADARVVAVWPSQVRLDVKVAFRSGVDGLVRAEDVSETLIETLSVVRSGMVSFPRAPDVSLTAAQALSSREKQVLGMLILGFTNAEIGRRLYLAESTVKSHLSSAYMKLGVRSRKDAAAIILDPDGGLGTEILAISGS